MKIDNNFLQTAGLGDLSASSKEDLLQKTLVKLEERVGQILLEQLTDDQTRQFKKLFESKDERKVTEWIAKNVPNYKQVVDKEIKKIHSELKHKSKKIILDYSNFDK